MDDAPKGPLPSDRPTLPLPSAPVLPEQLDRSLWAGAVRIDLRPAQHAPDALNPTVFPDLRTESEKVSKPEANPIPRARPEDFPDLWDNLLVAAEAVRLDLPQEVLDPTSNARINLAAGMPVPGPRGVEFDFDVNARSYLDPVYWSREFTTPRELVGGCDCTEQPCTYLFRSTYNCGTASWSTPVLVAGSQQTGGAETAWAVTADPCIFERRAADGINGCTEPLVCSTRYTVPFYLPPLTAGATEVIIVTGFGWSAEGVAVGDFFDVSLLVNGMERVTIEDRVAAVGGNPASATTFASPLRRFPTFVLVDRNQTLVPRITAKGPYPFTLGPTDPFNGRVRVYLEGYVIPLTDTRDSGYRGAGQGETTGVARGELPLAGADLAEGYDPKTIAALVRYLQVALAPGTPR